MNDINQTFGIDLDLEGAVAEAPGQFLTKVDARVLLRRPRRRQVVKTDRTRSSRPRDAQGHPAAPHFGGALAGVGPDARHGLAVVALVVAARNNTIRGQWVAALRVLVPLAGLRRSQDRRVIRDS